MPLNTSTTAQLREVMAVMGHLEGDVPDAELVDRIRLLEEIKSAAAPAQARATTAFVAVQEEAQRRAGVPERRVGKGIAAQVALARRESPARAQRYVGWSQVLTTELPRTYARWRVARDQWCRTPWCGAPIRHADHVVPSAEGGPTEPDNGQGLCEACNQAKEAPGWAAETIRTAAKPTHVETRTPTGHRYRSRAPDPPRAGPRRRPRSRLDIGLRDLARKAA